MPDKELPNEFPEQGVDVNTISKHSTHFLKAVELIENARSIYGVPSENWPHPLSYRFGTPEDNYYAELWTDGMDWQPNYWIVEAYRARRPTVYPLVVFDQHEDRVKFNDFDFEAMLEAMMYYRRNDLWIKQDGISHFGDSVWYFLRRSEEDPTRHFGKKDPATILQRFRFEHASQKPVEFWANTEFIPDRSKNISESQQVRSIEDIAEMSATPEYSGETELRYKVKIDAAPEDGFANYNRPQSEGDDLNDVLNNITGDNT